MRRENHSRAGVDCPAPENQLKRKIIPRWFWAIIFCFMASLAHAQTYYVSPSGEDSNPGTAAAPFRTINRALAVIGTIPGAGADQVIEVAAGTYNEGIIVNLPSGSSWEHPFTLRARPGDRVTIQAYDTANVFISNGMDHYTVIEGFVFDGANTAQGQVLIGNCCNPQPRSVRFRNNEFVNNRFGAFYISGENIEVINNRIHGGFEEYSGCGQVHCFGYAFYVEGSNNLFEGNEIYDVASWVFHIYSSLPNVWPENNVVRKNTIHDFGFGDSRADAILLSSGPRNTAYDNIIYNGANGISAWRSCDGCGIYNNQISSVNRCLEVSESSGVAVDGNLLSNCGSAYVNLVNAPGLALSNTSCDNGENCR